MKTTTALLLCVAVVIGLIAREVLADASTSGCPGSVRFFANHTSELNCPTDCAIDGRDGHCSDDSMSTTVNLWHYDPAAPGGGAWVKNAAAQGQPETYTGSVKKCLCAVNMGTEEEVNMVYASNPCCIVWRIPSLLGNAVHTVGITGSCSASGCPSGDCQASGNFQIVTAICD